MARAGIYANGKEIVARYVGDKLLWEKEKWVTVVKCGRPYDVSEWKQTIYTWSYITKEMSQQYPATSPKQGLQIRFHTYTSSQPVTISNVTGSHFYVTLQDDENGMSKRLWNKCRMILEFQNMEDLATFKTFSYDKDVIIIEVAKRG